MIAHGCGCPVHSLLPLLTFLVLLGPLCTLDDGPRRPSKVPVAACGLALALGATVDQQSVTSAGPDAAAAAVDDESEENITDDRIAVFNTSSTVNVLS